MKLTQSGVRDFQGCCPKFWYDKYVDGNRPSPDENMLSGLVFESICLGASADGKEYKEIRRLDSGQKSTRQLRIEEQAAKFKRLFNPDHPEFLGFTITDKQVELTHKGRGGTLDFIAENMKGKKVIFDIKMTQDIQGGYWSDLTKVDWIQQIHYRELFFQNYGYYPDSYVLIFDSSPKKNVKLIKVLFSSKAEKQTEQRFVEVEETISEYQSLHEFPRIPEPSQCAKCHLECSVRQLKPIIEYEEYEV